eukprot:1402856-Amphidinium_carterae.1
MPPRDEEKVLQFLVPTFVDGGFQVGGLKCLWRLVSVERLANNVARIREIRPHVLHYFTSWKALNTQWS